MVQMAPNPIAPEPYQRTKSKAHDGDTAHDAKRSDGDLESKNMSTTKNYTKRANDGARGKDGADHRKENEFEIENDSLCNAAKNSAKEQRKDNELKNVPSSNGIRLFVVQRVAEIAAHFEDAQIARCTSRQQRHHDQEHRAASHRGRGAQTQTRDARAGRTFQNNGRGLRLYAQECRAVLGGERSEPAEGVCLDGRE